MLRALINWIEKSAIEFNKAVNIAASSSFFHIQPHQSAHFHRLHIFKTNSIAFLHSCTLATQPQTTLIREVREERESER